MLAPTDPNFLTSNSSIYDFTRGTAKEVLENLFHRDNHHITDATRGYIDSIINDLEACGMLNEDTFNRLEGNILKYASETGYIDEDSQANYGQIPVYMIQDSAHYQSTLDNVADIYETDEDEDGQSNYDKSTAYVIQNIKQYNLLNILDNVLECDLNEAARLIQTLEESTASVKELLPEIFRIPPAPASREKSVRLIRFLQLPAAEQIVQDQNALLQGGENYFIHFSLINPASQQILQGVQNRPNYPLYQNFQGTYQNLQNQPIYQNFARNLRSESSSTLNQRHQDLQALGTVLQQLDRTIQQTPSNASQIDGLFHRALQLCRHIQQYLMGLLNNPYIRQFISTTRPAQQSRAQRPSFLHHKLHSPLYARTSAQITQDFQNRSSSPATQASRTIQASSDLYIQQGSQQLRQVFQRFCSAFLNLRNNIQKVYEDYQRTLPYRQLNSIQNLQHLQHIAPNTSTMTSLNTQTISESFEEDVNTNRIRSIAKFLTALSEVESQGNNLLSWIDLNMIDIINQSARSGFISIAEALLKAERIGRDEFTQIIWHPNANCKENFYEICESLSKQGLIDANKLKLFSDQMALNFENFERALEIFQDLNCLNQETIQPIIELADPQTGEDTAYFVIDFIVRLEQHELFHDPEKSPQNILDLCKYHAVFGALNSSETIDLLTDHSDNQALFDLLIQLCNDRFGDASFEQIAEQAHLIAQEANQFIRNKIEQMAESGTSGEEPSVHHFI